MKFSSFVAAVLSLEAISAFPQFGKESWTGKGLVARSPGGLVARSPMTPGSGRGGRGNGGREGDTREIPGFKPGSGRRNPDAPALNRDRVRAMTERAEREGGGRLSSPVRTRERSPEEGETMIQREPNPPGRDAPRYTAYLGTAGSDHTSALRDKERRQPTFRDAEYKPRSSDDHESRRPLIIGGFGSKADKESHRGLDTVAEEKGPNSGLLVPTNYEEVGIPGATAYRASGQTSRNLDSQTMNKLTKQARDDGGTYRIRSNVPEKWKGPEPLPLRAPKGRPGQPKPVHEYEQDDSATYGRRSTLTDDSSSGRSRSPREDERDERSYRQRENRKRDKRRAKKYDEDEDRRVRIKRDIIDQTTHRQSDADSQSEAGKTAEYKQTYQEMLQVFDMVRTNATDLILPIIYEFVNGSNSYLVWDAAWEIASLADPNMIVYGPFFQGMHAMDYWEDQVEGKVDNDTFTSILGQNAWLIARYQSTWKKCNETLTQAGYIEELDIMATALYSNETIVQDLRDDMSNTNTLNDLFLVGPDTDLAWWPGDETANFFGTANSTSNSTALARSQLAKATGTASGSLASDTNTAAATTIAATETAATLDATATGTETTEAPTADTTGATAAAASATPA
ncbi:MAG: hypothetical protein LQ351_004105 [Letrouitia transgressa]|nr:MAG: hypothetical protein LQ351_004105 [Letrouitia transgressa]